MHSVFSSACEIEESIICVTLSCGAELLHVEKFDDVSGKSLFVQKLSKQLCFTTGLLLEKLVVGASLPCIH